MKNLLRQERKERVVTFLDRNEVDFLDKLGKDALFSAGIKLSRTKLIAWLIDFMKELNINGKNIKSEKDFKNRIKEVMEQNLEGSVPTSPVTNFIQTCKFRICNGTSHGRVSEKVNPVRDNEVATLEIISNGVNPS